MTAAGGPHFLAPVPTCPGLHLPDFGKCGAIVVLPWRSCSRHRWQPIYSTGLRVDGIQPDRNLAFQVLADASLRQHRWSICPFLHWPEIVVPSGFRVRPNGLHRVGATIHKQFLVIPDDLRSRLQSHGHDWLPPFRRTKCRILFLISPPRGLRMWVLVDNPDYFFCQTAASGAAATSKRMPGDTTSAR